MELFYLYILSIPLYLMSIRMFYLYMLIMEIVKNFPQNPETAALCISLFCIALLIISGKLKGQFGITIGKDNEKEKKK